MAVKRGAMRTLNRLRFFNFRNFLRRQLRVWKSTPKAMAYGELGQQELEFTIWQRMEAFWKKLSHDKKKFCEFDVLTNQFQRTRTNGF